MGRISESKYYLKVHKRLELSTINRIFASKELDV